MSASLLDGDFHTGRGWVCSCSLLRAQHSINICCLVSHGRQMKESSMLTKSTGSVRFLLVGSWHLRGRERKTTNKELHP